MAVESSLKREEKGTKIVTSAKSKIGQLIHIVYHM